MADAELSLPATLTPTQERHPCRRGRAHHDLARAERQPPPIEALEDLKGLDSKQPDVIALMSAYHGLILQVCSCVLARSQHLSYSATQFPSPLTEAVLHRLGNS